MKECDNYTDRQYMHSAMLYRCPVCREQTLLPWHKRTRNISLEAMCEELPEYADRLAEIGHVPVPEESYDEIDLAKLSSVRQEVVVLSLYEEVMPALFDAAKEGRSFITIDDAYNLAIIKQ